MLPKHLRTALGAKTQQNSCSAGSFIAERSHSTTSPEVTGMYIGPFYVLSMNCLRAVCPVNGMFWFSHSERHPLQAAPARATAPASPLGNPPLNSPADSKQAPAQEDKVSAKAQVVFESCWRRLEERLSDVSTLCSFDLSCLFLPEKVQAKKARSLQTRC